jgi:hypothetical protein
MPAPHPKHVKDKAIELHAEGYSDVKIAEMLGVSVGGVGGWLNGKRVLNGKPHRIKLENGNHVCSRCGDEKHPDLFPKPRFNGSKLSEVSFCRACLSGRDASNRKGTMDRYLLGRFWSLKGRAAKNSTIFSLEEGDLHKVFEKQRGLCFYTQEKMEIPESRVGSGMRRAVSVDRVIPSKGYTRKNIVLCTYKANAVKQNLTLDEMYAWLPGWYWKLVDGNVIKCKGDKCRSVTY